MMQKPEAIQGRVEWSCPSNIALIKYWGKRSVQLPMNPSLSMTLEHCRTTTSVEFSYEQSRQEPEISFRFEGGNRNSFLERIRSYTRSLLEELPRLAHCRLEIYSGNSFPHSSGIASSASAMGALALCYLEISTILEGGTTAFPDLRRASYLARLGSGSAARSLFPEMALWGKSEAWPGSSDAHAIAVEDFHPVFRKLCDSILVISSAGKEVSSSLGHRIMEEHPFAGSRYRQAAENVNRLKAILAEGNWHGFFSLVEEEALTLHGLMMSGPSPYLLLKPASLAAIEKIIAFRKDSGKHLGFTLDAGANVHLIYDGAHKQEVLRFIDRELVSLCEEGQVIHDHMGTGPVRPEK